MKNKKRIVRIAVDILMTIALFFLMGYQFWGALPHRRVGEGIFLLFVLHHILNISWYKGLLKGKYTPVRIFQIFINVMLLVCMIAQMYSGIVMTWDIPDFLRTGGGVSFARRLHILGAYWGFVFMSVHIGLHWGMITGMIKRRYDKGNKSRIKNIPVFIFGLIVAVYGIFAFIKRNMGVYMFLRSEFVFMDFSELKILFYIDYLAIMGMCIFITNYIMQVLKKIK